MAAKKVYKVGDVLGSLTATAVGLPNTCFATGKEIVEGYWFARYDDEARSGKGFCQAYATKLAKPAPKAKPKEPIE